MRIVCPQLLLLFTLMEKFMAQKPESKKSTYLERRAEFLEQAGEWFSDHWKLVLYIPAVLIGLWILFKVLGWITHEFDASYHHAKRVYTSPEFQHWLHMPITELKVWHVLVIMVVGIYLNYLLRPTLTCKGEKD